MTTTHPPALPAGATAQPPDEWLDGHAQPYRIIYGADRRVTDHNLAVSPSAIQWVDGTIDNQDEPPAVYVWGLTEMDPLNSDQARELAAALLETAEQIDSWGQR
jgi:hypothetical protein